ncbi:MAG: hypothetical protein U5K70_06345 [Halodesulfurarchaeum sp.]|nr:hypothetical protein [Halodesulfurarchaeum sp.]
MPDDKRGREKQARNADRRQRERAMAAELERMDELEPVFDEGELARFETQLEELAFPATGTEIVSEMGHQKLDGIEETYSVAELLPATEAETFADPTRVRTQIERPTVAKAIKRIIEESEGFRRADLGGSKRETYEKTFLELEAIDAVDEDQGIAVVREWIIEELHENGELPGSRDVRRRAADFCREEGYEIRSDEWLGI